MTAQGLRPQAKCALRGAAAGGVQRDERMLQERNVVATDVETIQVSLAHAYPGTEFYDFAKANGFIVNEQQMVDDGGHQLAHIEYPGLPREEVLDAVHRFYDEYYFRPKAIFRIVKNAVFDSSERKRLYREAKAFMKLRAQRKKYVEGRRSTVAPFLIFLSICGSPDS